MSDRSIPENWGDQEGWESYYASLIRGGSLLDEVQRTGSISVDRLPQLVEELRENKFECVWVSGCGVSLMPRILAQGGLNVHATDISSSAIAFQRSDDDPRINALIQRDDGAPSNPGTLTAEVHDFSQQYLKEYFHFIINVKAIQGFDRDTMRQIANVHYQSLKPGGQAIFDTVNVQGERREILEESIVDAGFFLPYYELNVRYRAKLNETGIPYVFVLGEPIVQRLNEYADDERKWEQDTSLLRAIAEEFHQKRQDEVEAVKKRFADPETRMARVIYSTG